MARAGKKAPVAPSLTDMASIYVRPVCGNCRHWERYPDTAQTPGEDLVGDCCLNPPTVLDVTEDGLVLQARPVVFGLDRCCGDHAPQVH